MFEADADDLLMKVVKRVRGGSRLFLLITWKFYSSFLPLKIQSNDKL